MTKTDLAKTVINLMIRVEDSYIAIGSSYEEALQEACQDAGITPRQYLDIVNIARLEVEE